MVRIASLTLLLLAGSAAGADELPRFDIEAMCRAAPALAGDDTSRQRTDQSCIHDESEARSQLERQWTSFDARQRDTCVRETQVGGPPSYVDVLTCLQVANGSAPAAPPRRARRQP